LLYLGSIDFDRFTFGLYVRRAEALPLGEEESSRLQDAHLAYLASLGREGHVLAAGPLDDQDDVALRGIVIFSTDLDQARLLMSSDPAVRADRLAFELMSWLTPAGTVSFHAARLPESTEEATS